MNRFVPIPREHKLEVMGPVYFGMDADGPVVMVLDLLRLGVLLRKPHFVPSGQA